MACVLPIVQSLTMCTYEDVTVVVVENLGSQTIIIIIIILATSIVPLGTVGGSKVGIDKSDGWTMDDKILLMLFTLNTHDKYLLSTTTKKERPPMESGTQTCKRKKEN